MIKLINRVTELAFYVGQNGLNKLGLGQRAGRKFLKAGNVGAAPGK